MSGTNGDAAFSFGTATLGYPGVYNLCGSLLTPSSWSVADFSQVIGELTLVGPYVISGTALICTLQVGCSLEVSGVGLTTDNKILIIDGTGSTECGAALATKVDWGVSFENPPVASASSLAAAESVPMMEEAPPRSSALVAGRERNQLCFRHT
jgi:hypothetical protein